MDCRRPFVCVLLVPVNTAIWCHDWSLRADWTCKGRPGWWWDVGLWSSLQNRKAPDRSYLFLTMYSGSNNKLNLGTLLLVSSRKPVRSPVGYRLIPCDYPVCSPCYRRKMNSRSFLLQIGGEPARSPIYLILVSVVQFVCLTASPLVPFCLSVS